MTMTELLHAIFYMKFANASSGLKSRNINLMNFIKNVVANMMYMYVTSQHFMCQCSIYEYQNSCNDVAI